MKCLLLGIWFILLPLPLHAQVPPFLRDLKGIHKAQFNSDGTRIITQLRKGEIGLWDVDTGARISGDIAGDSPILGDFVVDPSQTRALVAKKEGGCRIFSLSDGKALGSWLAVNLRKSLESCVFFSEDGRRVVLFDAGGRAYVVNVVTGSELTQFSLPAIPKSTELLPAAEFSRDGAHLFVLNPARQLHRFDTRTWKEDLPAMTHPNAEAYCQGFAISRDGQYAVTFDFPGENGPDGQLQLWDTSSGKPLNGILRGKNGISGQFLKERKGLLVTPGRGETRILSVPELNDEVIFRRHDDVESSRVNLMPDGQRFLTWGYDDCISLTGPQGGILGVFHSSAQPMNILTGGDQDSIWVLLNNTAFLLEGHYDYYVIRLSAKNMRTAAHLRLLDYPHTVDLSPNGSRLLVLKGSSENVKCHLFDASTLAELPCTLSP